MISFMSNSNNFLLLAELFFDSGFSSYLVENYWLMITNNWLVFNRLFFCRFCWAKCIDWEPSSSWAASSTTDPGRWTWLCLSAFFPTCSSCCKATLESCGLCSCTYGRKFSPSTMWAFIIKFSIPTQFLTPYQTICSEFLQSTRSIFL